ncbi:beta-lactamase family protein [Pseudoflavitalea sp. G-6-1-2]|uniref:serine hydrolase domain-containing protein n=1 Tax=Pseudoflavitalea sp. G-6-1-2 TaxID=2728841 RepID=UPI00146D1811|nr:serine hydrolase domain-containing protein [Pseudoflavitalea sp. G-6-1-2]NML21704.1 beta-lactamase family protein [Pseudoflavitalea sp. G-6-1-2]
MSTTYRRLFIAVLFLWSYSYAQEAGVQPAIKSSNPLKTPIDSIIQRAAEHYMQSPATFDLSIGVIDKGVQHQYIFHRGLGNLSNSTNFWGLGSIAKTFAGIMLAQAILDKKVHLTDDIRKYLPGSYPNLQYQEHPVRIMDLANHTSAMPAMSRDYDDKYLDSITKLSPKAFREFYSVYTVDSLFRDMHRFTLDTVPGTAYRYNGNAMMVLIAILQRVYHKPYDQLVTSFLKKQLGMENTKPALSAAEEKQLLPGHDQHGKELPFIPDNGFRAAPSMFSTLTDMLKYAAANLSRKNEAINLSHAITFTKPAGMSMGLGWMLGKENNGMPYIMHTGRDGCGFTALCYLYPDNESAIILLVNDSSGQERLSDLKNEIISNLFRQ